VRRIHARGLVAGSLAVVSVAVFGVLAQERGRVSASSAKQQHGAITIHYPSERSVFPPDITAPTFLWQDQDESVAVWRIGVAFADRSAPLVLESKGELIKPGPLDEACAEAGAEPPKLSPGLAAAHSWKPDPETWTAIKRRSVERPAVITIQGFSSDGRMPVSSGRVSIRTSKDPVGAPIFYRDVPLISVGTGEKGVIMPLPSGALPMIAWRMLSVHEPGSKLLMTGLPTCANCHSFSRDGKTFGLDVDGRANDKGLYALVPLKKQTVVRNEDTIKWQAFSDEPAKKRFGIMSQVSPDGRFVVTSIAPPGLTERFLEKRLYNGFYKDYGFGQVFFPTRGILAWWSRESGKLRPLPGADDPRFVQAGAFWSPDGKYLIYSRAEAKDPYVSGRKPAQYANDPNETQIQYDLYRVPFNDGRGGRPEPVVGASGNGMSNNFPKVSPDGRWIVFVQNRNGFLMRPDSELFIVPFQGGKARRLQCNLGRMNSWHSFSPNGRWLVFASKGRSLYTQMYLTHIDTNGDASPAILIEDATAANRAVNLPEFLNISPDGLEKIEAPATEFYRLYDLATDLAQKGRHADAIPIWQKAVELEPQDARARYYLGVSLQSEGHNQEAIEALQKSVEINPDNAAAYTGLASVFEGMGMREAALDAVDKSRAAAVSEWRKTVEIYPEEPTTHFNLALALDKQGNLPQAIEEYRKTISLDPQNGSAYTNLGIALAKVGEIDEAIAQFEKRLALGEGSARAHGNLGAALLEKRRFEEAVMHCRKAVEMDPAYADAYSNLAMALAMTNRVDEAIPYLEKAVTLGPAEPEFRYKLGRLLAAKGRFDVAIPHLEEAVNLTGAQEPLSLELLAALYSEVGRFPDAVRVARQALDIAVRQNNQDLAATLRARISAYEASQVGGQKD